MAKLLVTGGAGFIGSHTCLALLEAGFSLVVIDDFSNSSPEALKRVSTLARLQLPERLQIIEGDIRNSEDLDKAFLLNNELVEAVIHFAGLKAVEESIRNPLSYWDVNVNGTCCLLEAMRRNRCRTIVFSSSATLYGNSERVPIPETSLIEPLNPYANTKAAVETLLADVSASETGWRIASLRYFNPVGAHPSGLIGEAPNGIPNNLFPYLTQVAIGRRKDMEVFGGDWPTIDGSNIRDYIHVMDLAEGHCAALKVLRDEEPQLLTVNLGSGRGYSVLEVLRTFEKESGIKVPFKIGKRRAGDIPSSIADPNLAMERLSWKTKRTLSEMCRDAWAWQQANPYGYSN